MNGYFEQTNGNKYLTLVPTNESKDKINKDDKLPINKTIKIPIITIVARAVFHENNKYYRQVFFRWMPVWSANTK